MHQPFVPSHWRGIAYGLLAAVGYTLSNVFLRMSTDLDPFWVSFVKAIPTVALFAPIALWELLGNRGRTLPTRKTLLLLVGASLCGHIFGNVMFQWSLGVVGVAMSVPLCLGSMILGGALLGKFFLGEEIGLRAARAMVMLLLAIAVLGLGARAAAVGVTEQVPPWYLVAAGVLTPVIAGFGYAILSVGVRNGVSSNVSVFMSLSVVCGVGMVVLGPICLVTAGFRELLATNSYQLAVMLIAGIWNAVAFLSLTLSLRHTSVLYVNSLNASQNAMAAVAGVLLFQEPLTVYLIVGVILTALGLAMMSRKQESVRVALEVAEEPPMAIPRDDHSAENSPLAQEQTT
ncbi:MAG: EamA family transporter [Pirellulaceae bacterium]